ncbi:unnamed protein product, partial [Urochloa humidicola]
HLPRRLAPPHIHPPRAIDPSSAAAHPRHHDGSDRTRTTPPLWRLRQRRRDSPLHHLLTILRSEQVQPHARSSRSPPTLVPWSATPWAVNHGLRVAPWRRRLHSITLLILPSMVVPSLMAARRHLHISPPVGTTTLFFPAAPLYHISSRLARTCSRIPPLPPERQHRPFTSGSIVEPVGATIWGFTCCV